MTEEPCKDPAIRVMMMPKDTNSRGTIFGGVVLSYLDQAGAVEAVRQGALRPVTVHMREINFLAPVFVGDIVSFYTETMKIGRTSITVRVTVEAERALKRDERVTVTDAYIVYVNVNEEMKPVPMEP